MDKVTTKKTTTKKTIAAKAPEKVEKTLTVDVYNAKGAVAGTMDVPATIFGAEVNDTLVAQAVRVYLANQRKGTASTKTRGQVAISTRKIYRQKGTGNARHGAKSAPIFVGGGVAHGPHPRDYSLQLSQKMKVRALASALTSKLAEKKVMIVDGLTSVEAKTRNIAQLLNVLSPKDKKAKRIMLVVDGQADGVKRAARNIEGVTLRIPQTVTTYEVLHNHTVIFMKDAVAGLEKRFETK